MTMQWCLECHRHPERHLRDKSDVFRMDLVLSTQEQLQKGRELVKSQRHRARSTDQLLGVPPMTQQPEPEKPWRADSVAGWLTAGAFEAPIFWRSLEELAGTPAGASDLLGLEFPDPAIEVLGRAQPPRFSPVHGGLAGPGGIGGCAYQPAESIVPYVQAPEAIVPGKPLFFASAVPIDGYACGVLVKSHMGRPINLEGNPAHPASLGAVDIFGQADDC